MSVEMARTRCRRVPRLHLAHRCERLPEPGRWVHLGDVRDETAAADLAARILARVSDAYVAFAAVDEHTWRVVATRLDVGQILEENWPGVPSAVFAAAE